jgi:8-oxo-dGTP diphosphatase
MREMLQGLNIDIIGLNDVGIDIDVDESGTSPLENARAKAMAYYKITGIPTFSCDSGLFIEGLEEEKQPGVHVRRINDKYLNDEEFIEYYTGLILNIGHDIKAKFKNAICLILNENHIFEYNGDDIADHFLMTSKPHNTRKPGFPMDSISLDIETGKYFMDTRERGKNEKEITEGFRKFFMRTVLNGK